MQLNPIDALPFLKKDISFSVKRLKKFFTNEDGSSGKLYLISIDLGLNADQIYEICQKNWQIETTETENITESFCNETKSLVKSQFFNVH